MFCDNSPHSDVKVIDFGLSKKYLPSDRLREGCGTIYSMAPEVMRGNYNQAADLWSLGVITFMLLSSSMPFFGKDQSAVIKKILSGKYSMRGFKWQQISEQAKDFVRKLLVVGPKNRPSAGEALRDDWIRNVLLANSTHSCNQELEEMVHTISSIEIFASYSKLKKLALMVIAHKATSQEIGFLRRIFDKFDRDHNGVIQRTEFKEALEGFGYSEEEITMMFTGCDLDGTGIIQYSKYRTVPVP